MISRKLRAISFFTAFVFALVVLGSAIFISVESDHQCVGENCSICEVIHHCENLLKTTGVNVVPVMQHLSFVAVVLLALISGAEIYSNNTLISLKVELLN